MGVLGAVLLSAMPACEPPTAADDTDGGAVALGRYNDNGASFWLPGEHTCAVVDGDGHLLPVPCSTQVATPSANSNATVTVKATGVPNTTGKTVHWGPENPGFEWAGLFYYSFGVTGPPYACGVKVGPGSTYFVDIVFTLDWHAIVTPSGEATVTCHYRDESAWSPW